ncbi:unnamed protein product [Mytilus edulis]|uniref:Uncharacterized protein n=1 Tax=Mytilus edulis TaxID=6550 RepID=A0A8S3RNE7_MYTED|nr:unnamed protein product [Mytilus edulis]
MEVKDGLVVLSFCLVITTAYFCHNIIVLQDEVKRQSSTIETLITNMNNLVDRVTRLQSFYDSVKKSLAENREHFKESFGDIIKETREVYRVTEEIHERINVLEDVVHRRRDTGILPLIRAGISRLVQIGLHFVFGPIAGYLESSKNEKANLTKFL